ncbi:pentatricopeptide repeat-containing protein At1g19720 isoform X2 [Magnolia sinica]|uniref:pentatricopeptide repeat-containing protein At1g19720 isoform X2 n=1 Tax=Magnolia sinica TaxID=86752 RepID=UPI002659027F|nr:pentatricopeptide repeat-containing protein At1g19720 isoform X2 [Magnolia sinica]
MEISTILPKSKHPFLDFFKQENPFEISSKPTKRIKKPNPICSKSLAKSLSKQDPKSFRPTISSSKKSNPTVQKSPPNITDNHLHRLRQTGHLEEAVTVLESIAQHGAKVRTKTYISLLQSCIDSDSIDIGRKIHARIGSVRNSNPFVETKLVSMYAKCGSLDEARRVFAEMRERNLFTWSAMIGACAREQRWEEIVKLFAWMMAEGVIPDGFLVPKIMQACANLGDVEMRESVHSIVIRSGLDSLVHVSNSILAMYAKCGRLHSAKQVFEKMGQKDLVTWNSMISGCCQGRENEEAMKLFDRMQAEGIEPGLITWNILIASYNQSGGCDRAMELMKKMESSGIMPDVFTWTSMISGSAQNNRTHQALDLFREMWLAGIEPNGVTIVSVVSACTSLKAFKKGTEIHSIAVKLGSANDVLVGNSLIDLYSKCGKVEDAQRVFDKILERDIFTWNSMIGGYVQAGYCGKAHDLFEKMQISGIRRNVVTWNVMISGYMQNGDEDQAMELFKRMETDGIKKSTASWNLLIAGSLQNGHSNKALMIFRQMQSICMRSNSVTILSVLPACANLVSATKVKEIHACVLRSGLDCEVSILNLLIDTYAKSGDIVSAQSVFDSLSSKDLISWNSLLLGFVLHGRSEIAIDLFNQMKRIGVKPNHTTFTSMIAAYGHAGMVNEGKELFSSMTQDYQISPVLEHYAGIIDLLGRSGRLREAAGFIEKMPVEPDLTVWAALLTACRVHGNISLAIHAAEHLIKLEPGNSVIHRLLLQLYALGGRTSDASKAINLCQKLMLSMHN